MEIRGGKESESFLNISNTGWQEKESEKRKERMRTKKKMNDDTRQPKTQSVSCDSYPPDPIMCAIGNDSGSYKFDGIWKMFDISMRKSKKKMLYERADFFSIWYREMHPSNIFRASLLVILASEPALSLSFALSLAHTHSLALSLIAAEQLSIRAQW